MGYKHQPIINAFSASSSALGGSAIGCSGPVWQGFLLPRTSPWKARAQKQLRPIRPKSYQARSFGRAGDRTRTGDVQLGNLEAH